MYNIKFINRIFSRYIYMINDIEMEMLEYQTETEMIKKIDKIEKALKQYEDFRISGLDIPLRDFMLISYVFFLIDLKKYLVYYIEQLILNNDQNKFTEVLIEKYIFNASITQIEYTIHSSTDKSPEKYNQQFHDLLSNELVVAKSNIIKKMLQNKDIKSISSKIKQFGINFFIDLCATQLYDDSLNYFNYIIEKEIISKNLPITLNYVIAVGLGISKKMAKDTKNIVKSKERDQLYSVIENMIEHNKPEFFLLNGEIDFLEEIHDALINRTKLNNGLLKKLLPMRIIRICLVKYRDSFAEYVAFICDELIREKIEVNRVNVIVQMFNDLDTIKANHLYTYYKMKKEDMLIEDIILSKIKEQARKQGQKILDIEGDIWTVYVKNKEKVYKYKVQFTKLQNSLLKNELKGFYNFILKRESKGCSYFQSVPSFIGSVSLVIESVAYLQQKLKISSAHEIQSIHVHKMIKYLQNDYKTKQNKNIRVSTIVKCVGCLVQWIYWLIENDNNKLSKPTSNPFEYVTIKGVVNQNTDIIPEIVVQQLLVNIDKLEEHYQRMLLIMLNCGMRFKEVANLTEDCFTESNEKYKILKYIPYKNLEARRRNGLDDYHRILVDDDIYKEIMNQMDYTKKLRLQYSTSEIFLRLDYNNILYVITSNEFCNAVQKINK